jgi:multisubunit Na+/H+ antiporter MnhF subunit
MSMIGMGIFPFLLYYLYAIVPLAPFVYLFIKWRAYRDGRPADPWLGAAVLLHYFWTLALHVALFGLCLALAGLIKGPNAEELKPGLGLLSAGVIALLAIAFALNRVPSSPLRPQVWRVFNALNLLLCGLVALVALCVATFMIVDSKWADARLPLVALAIFGAAWSWFLRLLLPWKK